MTKIKVLFLRKIKIFNHKQYRKHWAYTQRVDAERYAKKVENEGFDTKITIEHQAHPSVPSGKWYVLWKRKKR